MTQESVRSGRKRDVCARVQRGSRSESRAHDSKKNNGCRGVLSRCVNNRARDAALTFNRALIQNANTRGEKTRNDILAN